MQLKRLRMKNWCQYADADIEFGDGMTGIVGPNGSGKSNLVEAIKFAVTGRTRLSGAKDANLREIGPGNRADTGMVELEFLTHTGVACSIRRWIESSRVTLRVGDDPSITKATAANQKLFELLSVSQELLDSHVFVHQRELLGVIEQQPADRAKSLSDLFGYGRLEKTWLLLGEEMTTVRVDERVADDLESAERRCNTLDAEVQAKAAELKQVEDALSGLNVEEAKDTLDRLGRSQSLSSEVSSLQARVESARSAVNNARARRNTAADKLREVESASDGYDPAADDQLVANAAETNRKADLRDQLKRRFDELVEEISNLSDPTPVDPPSEDLKASVAAGRHCQAQLSLSLQMMQEARDGQDVPCPACGQSISDVEAYRDKLRRELDDVDAKLPAMLETFREQERLWQEYQHELSVASARRDRMSEEAREAVSKLNGLGNPSRVPDEAVREAQDRLNGHRSALQYANSLRSDLDAAEQDLGREQQSLSQWEEQLTSKSSQMQELRVPSRPEADQARHTVESAQRLREQKSGLSGSLNSLRGQLEVSRGEVARLRKLRDKQSRIRHYRDILSDLRDLFHRDRLPRVAAGQCIQSLNTRLAQFLDLMRSDFKAMIDPSSEGYEFLVAFDDGRIMPHSRLSPGQMVRLAIAFRLSVHDLFAGNVGLLCLDEPTVWLDVQNQEYLTEVLEHLERFAKSNGMQVLVITHSESLEGFFSRSIDTRQLHAAGAAGPEKVA